MFSEFHKIMCIILWTVTITFFYLIFVACYYFHSFVSKLFIHYLQYFNMLHNSTVMQQRSRITNNM
jgi:hypothetical protein